ncbi:MAG TPA: hypothetical protein VNO69_00290 [Methyloceanibacter sp.]|nr:hypothetical protein [Methyloceanibacter sp.]
MHDSFNEVVSDVRETNELLKEETKQGWGFWAVMVFLFVLLWITPDQTNLIRGVAAMVGLGFYYAFTSS